MNIVILTILGLLFAFVGWIGWRFFLAAEKAENLVGAMEGSAPVSRPIPDGMARNTPDLAWRNQPLLVCIRPLFHWPVWLALLLVAVVVAGMLALSGRLVPEPLEAPDFGWSERIQAALDPENLVPPPPLPPSIFAGTERPGLETADRDWTKLEADFAKRALLVFARVEARGYPFALLEGYRSPERQHVLAGLQEKVTNARAFQSKHQYGLALDAAPFKDGRLIVSERHPWAMEAYRVFGEEAEKVGLVWGGRWTLKDFGHIESPVPIQVASRQN